MNITHGKEHKSQERPIDFYVLWMTTWIWYLEQERREDISHSLHTIADHFQSFLSSLDNELQDENIWMDENEFDLSFPSTIGQTQQKVFRDELAR